MLDRKRITIRLGIFVAALMVLLGCWQPLKRSHADVFRQAANTLFGHLGRDTGMRFEPRSLLYKGGIAPDGPGDVVVLVVNHRGGNDGSGASSAPYLIETFHYSYLPVAVALALLIATPISRRTLVASALLTVAMAAFVALRVWLLGMETLSRDDSLAAFAPPELVRNLIVVGLRALVFPPTSNIVVPLLLWLAFAFRVEDWWVTPTRDDGRQRKQNATHS